MSNDIAPASPPPGAYRERDDAVAADPRIARAEQRLAMLQELSELGMAMTRRLARRVLTAPDAAVADPAATAASAEAAGRACGVRPAPSAAPAPAPGPRHDPADSFAKLSRAIRLTVALETSTDDDLAALRAGRPGRAASGPLDRADREADDGYDAEDAETFDDRDDDGVPSSGANPSAHRDRTRDRAFDAIRAEVGDVYRDHGAPGAPHEGQTTAEPRDAFANAPVREGVETIREDLRPHPRQSLWTPDIWAPSPPDAPRQHRRSDWAPDPGITERRRQ
jgi:hypothetical protein